MKNSKLSKINYLKLYRRKMGYTQKEVAALLGVKSSTAISNYENNKKSPSLLTLLKLEIILRTPVAFLYKDWYLEFKKQIRDKESKDKRKKSK